MDKKLIETMGKIGIEYKIFHHEPVLDYEKAREIREKFQLQGGESKSLFLKTKSGKYFVFVTIEGNRLDSKRIKDLIGERVSVVKTEELKDKLGLIPGCVSPVGYQQDIILIIDNNIFSSDKFVFSPSVPEITIELKTEDIKRIVDAYKNKVFYLPYYRFKVFFSV